MARLHAPRLRHLVLATTVAATLLSPTVAQAQTGSLLGEVAGSSAAIDDRGRPAPHVLDEVERFASQPGVAPQISAPLRAAVAFFREGGPGGVAVPTDGPAFRQFSYPRVGLHCLPADGTSVATAIAVPGPAGLPLPGHGAGEAAIVFTALGTGEYLPQSSTLQATWVNLHTWRAGQQILGTSGLNPQGPATVSTVLPTGSGEVLAVITGGLSHSPDAPQRCEFLPTVGGFEVR